MVIYILTKFGDDWFIFVDVRVLTRKLWMHGRTDRHRTDGHGQTVSDHNSSQNNPCSGELKTLQKQVKLPINFNKIIITQTKLDFKKNDLK